MTKLLFQEDSYLRESNAKIIEILENGLVLEDTIFYPRGGGQDSDKGSLYMKGKEFPVHEVKRSSGKVVHFTKMPLDGIVPGDYAKMVLDWERRYRMMRYHTALHLLSSVAYREFGAQITGNNIAPNKARIDLNLEGLTEGIINDIEKGTNDLISQDIPVEIRNVPRSQAEAMVDPKKTRLDLIPMSIIDIRLVIIGDKDIDACGGTHVGRTGEIKGIEIFNSINKGKNRKRLEIKLSD